MIQGPDIASLRSYTPVLLPLLSSPSASTGRALKRVVLPPARPLRPWGVISLRGLRQAPGGCHTLASESPPLLTCEGAWGSGDLPKVPGRQWQARTRAGLRTLKVRLARFEGPRPVDRRVGDATAYASAPLAPLLQHPSSSPSSGPPARAAAHLQSLACTACFPNFPHCPFQIPTPPHPLWGANTLATLRPHGNSSDLTLGSTYNPGEVTGRCQGNGRCTESESRGP